MKRVLIVVTVLALVGFVGGSVFAAEMVKEGAQRLTVTGAADYASTYGDLTGYTSSFSAAAEYGYMFQDQFELGVRGTFAMTQSELSAPGTPTYRSQDYAIDLVPKWRPKVEGNISPFIGPKLGARYVTNSVCVTGFKGTAHNTVPEWGAVLGMDIFLGKNIALVVEYDYTQFTVKTPLSSIGVPGVPGPVVFGQANGNVTVRDHALTAGLAWWW